MMQNTFPTVSHLSRRVREFASIASIAKCHPHSSELKPCVSLFSRLQPAFFKYPNKSSCPSSLFEQSQIYKMCVSALGPWKNVPKLIRSSVQYQPTVPPIHWVLQLIIHFSNTLLKGTTDRRYHQILAPSGSSEQTPTGLTGPLGSSKPSSCLPPNWWE